MGEEEPHSFGVLRDQQYTAREVRKLGRTVLAVVLGDRDKDAGKVYCPCCRLREARWRRHFEDDGGVRLFIYCTQCHKTGVCERSGAEVAAFARRGCGGMLLLSAILSAAAYATL